MNQVILDWLSIVELGHHLVKSFHHERMRA